MEPFLMKAKRLLACFLLGAVPASGASLDIDFIPTTDLPGFTTITFSIGLDDGEVFRGVDARIEGPMNQINPFGVSTVFEDFNSFFPSVGADASQDSQFLFTSGEVLSIGAEESGQLLKGAISGLNRLDFGGQTTIPFAQVAADKPIDIGYDLFFDLGGSEPVQFSGKACLLGGCPTEIGATAVIDAAPAIGLPGFTTYTLSADIDQAGQLRGVDGGFLGSLYQSYGMEDRTTFQSDLECLACDLPAEHAADSHFLFDRAEVLNITGAEQDSEQSLQAAFTILPESRPAGLVPIAQVTARAGVPVDFDFFLDLEGNSSLARLTGVLVPEPATAAMVAIGLGVGAVRQRRWS